MKLFKTLLKLILILGMAMGISACSKTVQWEEEVLLNTGETITVNKEVRYSIKGQSGNPADLGYLPDSVETISFKYGGRSYKYTGRASLMVLAISLQKIPVLLADPVSGDWYRYNSYSQCAKPYYVQFMPDNAGQTWTWPEKIEPWTYNLPTNLLIDRPHPSDVKRRYTMSDKAAQGFMHDPLLVESQKIDPLLINRACHEGK